MICSRFKIADIFGVSPDTVRAWVRSGCPVHREPLTGKGVSNAEKCRLFDSARVHHWLLNRALGRRW
jgi:phage terminase Nu1 subunit (DNA packaging protein)